MTAITPETTTAGWGEPSPPRPSSGLAWGALAWAALLLALASYVLWQLRGLLQRETLQTAATDAIMALGLAMVAGLFVPAFRALTVSSETGERLAGGDLIGARVAAVRSRHLSFLTYGYGAAALVVVTAIAFLTANNAQVSRTFFDVALIYKFYPLVLKAFWTNVYIFCTAEVLVLVWGLIVAIARLVPGEAGGPIRFLAMAYCDVFRGLPAIITIYLIGFGLSLAEVPILSQLPLPVFAILALTLVYGAYVAEVYRAGIESVHWSQTAAARSLGLSHFQTLRHVIVPQAVRRIMAPLLNDFIGLQKDTALVMVIGVLDAFAQSRIIASNHFNLSAVTIVGILFVLITIPQARLVDRLVEADQRRMRAGS